MFNTITLRLREARIDRDPNLILKMRPYAVIRTSRAETRTSVANRGGQHPTWDESFNLDVTGDNSVYVALYDHEIIGRDNLIAESYINLNSLNAGLASPQSYPLTLRGQNVGILIAEVYPGANSARNVNLVNNNLMAASAGYVQAPLATSVISTQAPVLSTVSSGFTLPAERSTQAFVQAPIATPVTQSYNQTQTVAAPLAGNYIAPVNPAYVSSAPAAGYQPINASVTTTTTQSFVCQNNGTCLNNPACINNPNCLYRRNQAGLLAPTSARNVNFTQSAIPVTNTPVYATRGLSPVAHSRTFMQRVGDRFENLKNRVRTGLSRSPNRYQDTVTTNYVKPNYALSQSYVPQSNWQRSSSPIIETNKYYNVEPVFPNSRLQQSNYQQTNYASAQPFQQQTYAQSYAPPAQTIREQTVTRETVVNQPVNFVATQPIQQTNYLATPPLSQTNYLATQPAKFIPTQPPQQTFSQTQHYQQPAGVTESVTTQTTQVGLIQPTAGAYKVQQQGVVDAQRPGLLTRLGNKFRRSQSRERDAVAYSNTVVAPTSNLAPVTYSAGSAQPNFGVVSQQTSTTVTPLTTSNVAVTPLVASNVSVPLSAQGVNYAQNVNYAQSNRNLATTGSDIIRQTVGLDRRDNYNAVGNGYAVKQTDSWGRPL